MDGTLERRGGRWQLGFTRRLPHPPEKVWRALIEPEHLAAWFPAAIEGERAAGAPLRFVHRDGRGPTLDGVMLACDPPSLLELRWGDETLRFELRPDGAGTLLLFVNTFDQIGKAARDAAGWHACLDVLACHLDGEPPPWTPAERWQQVHEGYVARFGLEAATIGPPAPNRET
ncbi:MAG TPA: SRPBCC family protein [Candidatus Eisenbacteria bacterium]|nr:SRPBCC family protein [Candidatus Eisenbacteria bacterium]